MDIEKLRQIGKTAESMGFEVRINKAGYATFEAPRDIGKIRVDFEHNSLKQVDEVHVNWSAESTKELSKVMNFSFWIEQAIVIADKLQETKVNGAE